MGFKNFVVSNKIHHFKKSNVPQLGQYEGNILETFNFCTEEVQEKLQHLSIYKSTAGPDMLPDSLCITGQTC